MEQKVPTDSLSYGLYVYRLDRPWLETPFLLQGFYIRDERDLKQLREHCEFVFVDTDAPPPRARAS